MICYMASGVALDPQSTYISMAKRIIASVNINTLSSGSGSNHGPHEQAVNEISEV